MQLDLKYRVLLFCLSTLLIFLPLNTVLVQFLVVNLGLPVWLTLWKELCAAMVILICGSDIIIRTKTKIHESKLEKLEHFKSNLPLICVSLMTLVGLLNSFGKVGWNYILYGFRFELFWLWLWIMLYTFFKIQNSKFKIYFSTRLLNSAVLGFFFSTLFSLLTIVIGTDKILSLIGYGKQALQAGNEFLFVQPAGHLIDAGGWNSSFRLAGTFSSPNHYAIYLILLLPLFMVASFGKFKIESGNTALQNNQLKSQRAWLNQKINYLYQNRFFWVICLILDLLFLGLTFARFSYLVLFVFAGILVVFRVQNSKFKIQNWLKNFILGLILLVPILISLVVLNLPVSVLQSHFPSWLAKPSSTEWHQQHTAAAFRTLTYETFPDILNDSNLKTEQILLISNLQLKNQNPESVIYRMLTGYGMGTTDPASKYLPLAQNPIAKLGFGIDDEKYFPRQIERPLATTPENWFLGLWVKGGIFYMVFFLAVLIYYTRDLNFLFLPDGTFALQEKSIMLKVLVSLSIFGLIIASFLLDIFDSQTLALFIGPIYFFYSILNIE